MTHIKRWYNILSYDELVDKLHNCTSFLQPSIALSIDDGFRDNYDLACRTLIKLQLPAIIFLTSGLIGTNKAPWVDEIYHAMWNTNIDKFECPELFGDELIDISTSERKVQVAQKIYKYMLNMEYHVTMPLADKLIKILNSEKVSNPSDDRFMLNWNEVKELHKHRISFCSHTVSHPILSRMPFDRAVDEIKQSKATIEEKLGVPVYHFAIPNGKDEDFTEELRDFCKEVGFKSIATTNFGCVKQGTDPYKLPRISPSQPLFLFAGELLRSFIFS